jgi:outer membrane protein OmpA-like peptidoglycan-associated protein
MIASGLSFDFQHSSARRSKLGALPLVVAILLAACAAPSTDPEPQTQTPPATAATAPTVVAAAPTVTAPAPAIVSLPHQEAVLAAARDLFGKAQLPANQSFNLVIDPLVDGSTGMQSLATSSVEKQVLGLLKTDYPRFQVKPLNSANIAAAPLVFIGTFTPINLQGKGTGERDAYRVCFALADLKTGKIVSKGFARSQTAGVDATPLPYFQDAPLWVNDKIVEGYIKTCQGTKAGDPINPDYLDKVAAMAGIDEAVRSYNGKKYQESLALFTSLLRSPAGDQPRVHTGVYLSNLKLGRREPAMQAFGKITKQGLDAKRLAVKFNFQPGGASFAKDTNPYDRWLKELAGQSTLALKDPKTCFEVAGHTSRGGSEPMNERVTLQRAEYVKQRLVAEKKELASRISTKGYGSTAALVATGKDDSSDALDRRIEMVAKACT